MASASENKRVFARMLRERVDEELKPQLVAVLKEVAKWMVGAIEGDFELPIGNNQFPVWSANLRDSTGVGVYVDGVVESFVPTKKATKDNDGAVGSELLASALGEATGEFAGGIWIVLFSTVPYAYKVNTEGSPRGRGVGFFESLADTLKLSVFNNLEPIGSITNKTNLFN